MTPRTVAELGEEALVAQLRVRFATSDPRVVVGIGDDGAVLASDSRPLVLVADAMVEDVHFRLRHGAARDLGHKALAINASDLAAMGAVPVASLLTLSFPGTLPAAWALDFIDGAAEAARHFGAPIIGGDVTGSRGGVSVSVSMLGHPGGVRCLLRSGARAGHGIWVTGTLGLSGLGFELLEGRLASGADAAAAVARHQRGQARLPEGLALAASPGVGAVMDVSDGLLVDAPRLATASQVTLHIDLERLPIDPLVRRLAPDHAEPLALAGGEDYELLFTYDGEPPIDAQRIGTVVAGPARVAWLRDGQPDAPRTRAFAHFD